MLNADLIKTGSLSLILDFTGYVFKESDEITSGQKHSMTIFGVTSECILSSGAHMPFCAIDVIKSCRYDNVNTQTIDLFSNEAHGN